MSAINSTSAPSVEDSLQRRLSEAIARPDVALIKQLISEGADVNGTNDHYDIIINDQNGENTKNSTKRPIHTAAEVLNDLLVHSIAALTLLLDAGADVDAGLFASAVGGPTATIPCMTDQNATTALLIAARRLSHNGMKVLLAEGADPNGLSPTPRITVGGVSSVKEKEHAHDGEIKAPLVTKCDDSPTSTRTAERSPATSHGVANTLAAANHKTPLIIAAGLGDIDGVRLLIAAGADVTRIDDRGWTALHHAAWCNDAELISVLMEASGADVDGSLTAPMPAYHPYTTPLHVAASTVSAEAVKALLDHGADVNTVIITQTEEQADVNDGENNHGNSLPHTSLLALGGSNSSNVFTHMSALLLAAQKASKTPEWYCGRDTMQHLLDAGADIDELTTQKTLLWSGEHSVCRHCQFDRHDGCCHSTTMLHVLAAAGKTRSLEIALCEGASANCLDSNRRTAIELAVSTGHGESAEVLRLYAKTPAF